MAFVGVSRSASFRFRFGLDGASADCTFGGATDFCLPLAPGLGRFSLSDEKETLGDGEVRALRPDVTNVVFEES